MDYRVGMLKKKKLYQQEGKKITWLYPDDLPAIDEKLTRALQAMGYAPQHAGNI